MNGARVVLRPLVEAAIDGTSLFVPDDFAGLVREGMPGARPRVEVVAEGTVAAAQRLVAVEGERGVALLNFASAKNPGGGFLRGAKSQEEDLARCSALYVCVAHPARVLRRQPRVRVDALHRPRDPLAGGALLP